MYDMKSLTKFKMATSSNNLMERLDLWDSKEGCLSPLTDDEKDSVLLLATYSMNRAMPSELPEKDITSLPSKRTHGETSESKTNMDISDIDLGSAKVENAQQFFTWFAQVENQMEREQESAYHAYCKQLQEYRDHCEVILNEINEALKYLKLLHEQHLFVSTKTGALHYACEQLLQDQTRLVQMAESISDKLSYFNALEQIKQKVNTPTLSVTNESFVPMLSRLDECIEYIKTNQHFKESQTYLIRYSQCLNEALNLVKTHVIDLFKYATVQVTTSKNETNSTDGSFALFYGKFRTNAPRIKSLMEQIEQRLTISSEYLSLLKDCHDFYFTQRYQLLAPCIHDNVEKIIQQHQRNTCALVRSGCSLLMRVSQDEYQLYFHFFNQPSSELHTLLENFCTILYDAFRPLIIHMNHMETLTELCSILKVEMLEDHVSQKGDELLAFGSVIAQMLEDVQERLVYRAQTYIQTDIQNYSPSPGDLAYPDKLMIRTAEDDDEKQSENDETEAKKTKTSDFPAALVDLQGMWYPTVRRTLVCLSKLYRCISKETFEGLSQEALSVCISTLKVASSRIISKTGAINGHLFLIKHLLILREQIAPFNVDFTVRELSLDFSNMRTAAYGLWSKSSSLFSLNSNNALLEFLLEGAPKLIENYVDSKKEVDNELKTVCEQFIDSISSSLVSPLKDFLSKTDAIQKLAEEDGKDVKNLLKHQHFAKPENVRRLVSESYMLLKSKIPSTLQIMSLYLANKDTEYILFKPVKGNVLENYKRLNELIVNTYNEENQQIIGSPTTQQISLLLSIS
ncbi:conserved oligomeric Golgi complex subunit 3-like [Xenia sp. Carnegie-2017]|uniref:conserved oligomeric Golgi complex subunit 3-like n=1 Tax=Xenia sp. Carnegie-2017 TaxID=2897299 RepID=UPI001F041569|nr:conserved oligomeric Golgi complex subunit 3-like [Xenia sp. Carnegie-2017]XP_046853018.1 conserved oligomeric Golgi complex subunit 3-like [Xenia sp. Carnegie-2017]